MDVRAYKLSSGEEIIGRFESEDENSITLSKVRAVGMIQQGGGIGITILPYVGSTEDDEIKFFKAGLTAQILTPDPRMVSKYVQGTTGIALQGT